MKSETQVVIFVGMDAMKKDPAYAERIKEIERSNIPDHEKWRQLQALALIRDYMVILAPPENCQH